LLIQWSSSAWNTQGRFGYYPARAEIVTLRLFAKTSLSETDLVDNNKIVELSEPESLV
jgi:hypothetical protein